MPNNQAYIYDWCRTPRGKGKPQGALHKIKPLDLIGGLMRHFPQRLGWSPQEVQDVILGCVTQWGEQGMNLAKTAALHAKWPDQVPGVVLNRFCGSGLEAINQAAARIMGGMEDLLVAGGVESMSRVPLGADLGAYMMDPAFVLENRIVPQGIGADLIASLEGFSRQAVDSFALASQQKAALAQKEGRFARSLVPVLDRLGDAVLEHDELVRPDTSLEGLAKLAPSFAALGAQGLDDLAQLRYRHLERIEHVHHAGNASGIVDGAALMLIGSAAAGQRLGLKPRAVIRSYAVVGSEPTIMLTGPVPAMELALQRAGLPLEQVELFEINEAFAAVVLKAIKDMKLDPERVNVNGGAIALGHPLGATGCILLGTLLDELERRQGRFGLASLCIGGGMGIATLIERIPPEA